MNPNIIIRNARLHNLKNVTLEIPKNQIVFMTELSGSGNSVIVVKHNLYLVKAADWVIDLGPEGDQLLAEGTPEDVAKVEESYIGQCLKGML